MNQNAKIPKNHPLFSFFNELEANLDSFDIKLLLVALKKSIQQSKECVSVLIADMVNVHFNTFYLHRRNIEDKRQKLLSIKTPSGYQLVTDICKTDGAINLLINQSGLEDLRFISDVIRQVPDILKLKRIPSIKCIFAIHLITEEKSHKSDLYLSNDDIEFIFYNNLTDFAKASSSRFGDLFRRQVILPMLADISNHTDISLDISPFGRASNSQIISYQIKFSGQPPEKFIESKLSSFQISPELIDALLVTFNPDFLCENLNVFRDLTSDNFNSKVLHAVNSIH